MSDDTPVTPEPAAEAPIEFPTPAPQRPLGRIRGFYDSLGSLLGKVLRFNRQPRRSIRVLYDRVLVRRHPTADELRGIHIPDAHQKKPQEGTVIATDPRGRFFPGLGFLPLQVQPGDHVIFGKHAGVEVELIEGEEVFIVREDEIMGIREDAAEATEAA